MKNAHSEAAKRKSEDSAKLARLELLHTNKVPRLSLGDQSVGAVSTRSMKQNKQKADLKPPKDEPQSVKRKLEDDDDDMSDFMNDGFDDFFGRDSRSFRVGN